MTKIRFITEGVNQMAGLCIRVQNDTDPRRSVVNPRPVIEKNFDELLTSVYHTNAELGMAAAEEATGILMRAVNERGEANIILATGNSQLTFLNAMKTMIPALLAAKQILALGPEGRKAEAVRRSLTEPVSEACPGSILRRVPHAHLYLDGFSATKILNKNPGP